MDSDEGDASAQVYIHVPVVVFACGIFSLKGTVSNNFLYETFFAVDCFILWVCVLRLDV